MQDEGYPIFVQSDERRDDGFRSLKERANSKPELVKLDKEKDRKGYAEKACQLWIDVRSFGQVFAFGGDGDAGGTSIPVRGPVTIQSAYSVEPVEISSLQITKSVNLETNLKDPDKKAADTMGMKHRVEQGVYVTYGSVNVQLAEKTGFSDEDAEGVKQAMRTLFVNDVSSARPDGSMEVRTLIWWKHEGSKTGKHSSAAVHRSLQVNPDGSFSLTELEGLVPEVIDGV